MISIEDVFHSLATLIVCYHNSFYPAEVQTPEECRKKALTILQNKQAPVKDALEKLINDCPKDYTSRKHFLTYILNEIMFLKPINERVKPFTPEELAHYKTQMFNMFRHFHALLKTYKTDNYNVQYSSDKAQNQVSLSLSGLKQKKQWMSPLLVQMKFQAEYCKSGDLMLGEVLLRRNLSAASSQTEIKALTDKMCDEHQDHLKANSPANQPAEPAAQIKELSGLLEKANMNVTEQTQKATTLTAELAQAKANTAEQVKKLTEELAKANMSVTEQTQKATTLTAELAQAKANTTEQVKKLTEELAKAKADTAAQIKDLTTKLEQAEARVKELQASSGSKPAQITPVFSPGMMFFAGSMAKWKANQAATKAAAPDAGAGATATSG